MIFFCPVSLRPRGFFKSENMNCDFLSNYCFQWCYGLYFLNLKPVFMICTHKSWHSTINDAMIRTDLYNDFMTSQPNHHPAIENNNNIQTIKISCNIYVKKNMVDWLVLNTNFSNISAISWCEQILCKLRHQEDH